MAKKRRDVADFYTLKAKREGYPARSVYKLEEIHAKHPIAKPGDTLLDVGASPGSWSLYAHNKILKGKGVIVAVDLKPLELDALPHTLVSYTGDAFSKEIQSLLLQHAPFDAIISDAAPSTTGNRSVDTSRSEHLADQLLLLAQEHLKVGGNLLIKLFQGGAEQTLLQQMRLMFTKAKAFKPKASRSDSFEIFLIGLAKKG